MQFVDECELRVEAGNGGDGAIAFRRERSLPLGGPAGGDGGRGGSVIFQLDEGKHTLGDLVHTKTLRAEHGENGQGSDCYGKAGKDLHVRVPPGTLVYEMPENSLLGEITPASPELVVAKGGNGGRGNRHFTSSVERAPRRAEEGQPGEKRDLRLELQVMADVGLLGFPNVGKSTFIRAVSRARPRVADYPFTTLEPHLGVVTAGDSRAGLGQHFVVADIPGLVPGAAEGHGLGHQFLRHVERTRVLLHVLTLTPDESRDPISDYLALRHELELWNPALCERTEVVALNQADRPEVEELYAKLKTTFKRKFKRDLFLISAATGKGVDPLIQHLAGLLQPKTQD
jgi:GTP-binding protein